MYWAKSTQAEKLERLLKEAEPAAKAAKTEDEFDRAMDDMIAKFGDSHFDFLTRREQGFYLFDGFAKGDKAAKMPNIGAWFKKAKDGYTVQMVLNGGAAESAGVRKGDRMSSVDGAPFSPVDAFASKVGKDVRLEFKRTTSSGEKTLAETVKVTETPGQEMFLEATRKSGKIIEHGGKKFGYIHLWTMANDKFRQALENFVYNRAANTDAFILDIRDGFGGRPEGFGDPFFRPKVDLEWTVGGGGTMKQMFGYQKPLIVIINEGSRSAKDVFSYIMKKTGRGVLVGNRSAGDVLGTSPNAVGDWAYVEIPMVDVKVDGIRLEHNPVQADVKVDREFDEAGSDLYLRKAIDVALERSKAAPGS